MIHLFYEATIPSLSLYACAVFYGLLTNKIKTDLEKPECITECLIQRSQLTLKDFDSLYHDVALRLVEKILKNKLHPLNKQFEYLPSGQRYRVPRMKTARFKDTFIKSIEFFNFDNVCRSQDFNALL